MYQPLHVHTHYSLMDGVATSEEYAARAIANGQTALPITDHGTLSGHFEHYRACKAAGIKPILGIEAYFTWDSTDRRDRKEREGIQDVIYNHIVILAKNDNGLRNLNKLNERAWVDGFFHKPRMDWDSLVEFKEDLIITSGCLSGPVNKALEDGDLAGAKRIATQFKDEFGENWYLEVMPHNPTEMNEQILELGDALGIKCIATPDCHHATTDQREVQEMALLLNTHNRVIKGHTYEAACKHDNMMDRLDYLYGEDRFMTFRDFNIHLLSPDEMRLGMVPAARLGTGIGVDREDIYSNTCDIADSIEEYHLPEGLDLLPVEYADPDKQLRGYAIKGLKAKGLTGQEYKDRLDEELSIIKGKGFSPYFLVVRTITNFARQRKIRMSPGRGSAAGSLTAYALGITNIDPIKNNLLFFRFIDPSRDDFPDIDMDFQDTRRGEVIEFIENKYGHVSFLVTFMKFGDKSVVRDVSRALNIPLAEVNRTLKSVQTWDDFEFSKNEAVREFRNKYPDVLTYGKQLHGRIRGTGLHPAAIVTSKVPLSDVAPMETRKSDDGRVVVAAIDKEEAERIGLIKMDILGLKTLTVIDDTISLIRERHGIEIDLENDELLVNPDDPRNAPVWDMLSGGLTKGVFQCEASDYTNLIMEMGVHNFDELVASNALVRPGAKKTIGVDYLDRKHGLRAIKYPHKAMEQYLDQTFGCILYQEQVMQACVVLGGMTMVEANKVRRIIGKKKDVAELDVYRNKFVTNATDMMTAKQAEKLWHDFEAHAGYSFNLSHAFAYSVVSFWTAWLKYHYPLEFFKALLANEKDANTITDYLIEAKRMNIKIKFPHINLSDVSWKIDGDGLRFGLKNIKYISDVSAQRFIDARPFESYEHLAEFVGTKGSGVNSRSLGSLRAIGAANIGEKLVESEEVLSNAYEYLGLPTFNFVVPTHWYAKMTQAVDYSEGDPAVLFGYVRSLKSGTGWQLFEAMDSTGTFSFFCRPSVAVEVGEAYLFVIADKDAVAAIPVDSLDGTTAVERYLDESTERGYVLAASSRLTKTKQKMGTVVIDDGGELVSAVLFASNFAQVAPRIKPGNTYDFNLKPSRSGGWVLNGLS